VSCARRRPPPPAAGDRAHDDPDSDPEDDQIDDHLPVTTSRAALVLAVISPKPAVENTVTVKYSLRHQLRALSWGEG
jgi:hypothetical protein